MTRLSGLAAATALTLVAFLAGCSQSTTESASSISFPDAISLERRSAMAGLRWSWRVSRTGAVSFSARDGESVITKRFDVGPASFIRIAEKIGSNVQQPKCDVIAPDPSGGAITLYQDEIGESYDFVGQCLWTADSDRRMAEQIIERIEQAEEEMSTWARSEPVIDRRPYSWPPTR